MGFFNRRPRDGPAPTTTGTANGHHRAAHDRNVPYSMATRPSFGQWLKYTWLDILTMAAMGAIGLGVGPSLLQDLEYSTTANHVPTGVRGPPGRNSLVRGDVL